MARDHVVIEVEVQVKNMQELLDAADAVERLNRDLSKIAAVVDGRQTKDGWELDEGWKATSAE